jgi:hypothetical protein
MCKTEDKTIETISAFSLTQQFASSTSSKMVTKPSELAADSCLYDILANLDVILEINGIEHSFPDSKPFKQVAQPWFEVAKEYQLPKEHASLINMAITNLE